MTTIITSIMGSYDTPKSFEDQTIPCRMLLVTDAPQHPSTRWEVVYDHTSDRHPRLAAKRPKLYPWLYSDDGPWIWIDGSMEIVGPRFAEEALAAVATVGMWKHPARDCAYEEAEFSATLGKYQGQPLADQMARYEAAGLPHHWGLWAAGCIVWWGDSYGDLSNRWMSEIDRWGIQDQVSLPYAAWKTGVIPEHLPHHLLDNPWLRLHFHHDGTS